jgi:Mlc titration factor MtfA (ptsG expression regulator)
MFPFIAIVVIGAILIYTNYGRIREVAIATDRKAAPLKSRMLPVPRRFRQILLKYFPYYGKLNQENRKRFEKKLVKFLYSKRFIPRGVPEVTLEARVLISASAVQLTFGLPDIYMAHFNKILVYPNDYYSSITRRYHKGEVNPLFGIIVLSWQSFIDGYIYQHDSVNLGLHEMAHALRLENIIRNEEYNFFDATLLNQLDEFAHQFCNDPKAAHSGFLRPYACTNVHEFFSVAVENFFERPAALLDTLPELYKIISRLLNQDPLKLTAA